VKRRARCEREEKEEEEEEDVLTGDSVVREKMQTPATVCTVQTPLVAASFAIWPAFGSLPVLHPLQV